MSPKPASYNQGEYTQKSTEQGQDVGDVKGDAIKVLGRGDE